jgi:hypothetical protein
MARRLRYPSNASLVAGTKNSGTMHCNPSSNFTRTKPSGTAIASFDDVDVNRAVFRDIECLVLIKIGMMDVWDGGLKGNVHTWKKKNGDA